ncbi:hypothetical protein [Halorarius litoreus]|uniref:hypothetical protein n=1 Tax=Halorarius litoreus TaxID=2962676 RepID=UPI0020CE426A|nr:hypothetical protein [Halorarius litoreus]
MTNVAFRAVADPPGLEIQDRVSNRQATFTTPARPVLEPASTDPFRFPVEAACRFSTDEFSTRASSLVIRDATGAVVSNPMAASGAPLPEADYVVEFDTSVKAYLRVTSPIRSTFENDQLTLTFAPSSTVTVGARSYLQCPAATVTTTDDLDDVRRAVETLSSALQTTSPERSYPTLRGHPPRIERGETLSIPDGVAPPGTGITIDVRERLDDLIAVAPLAYYLGASIRFASQPRLRTDDGLDAPLSTDPFETAVEDVLGHTFLLDCLCRTHGLYDVETEAYTALAPTLSLDFERLYDATPAERLAAYLTVSTDRTAPYVPRWPTIAYVEQTPAQVAQLPHLVNDLTLIRTTEPARYRGASARRVALSRFVTASSPRGASAVFDGQQSFVDVPETAARHQLWVGSGLPLNADHFQLAGHEHRLARQPDPDTTIHITVICNDPEMTAEAAAVRRQYRPRPDHPFEVTVHEQVDRDRFADLLAADIQFLHYIGHATEAGLECPDGDLDVGTVETVNTDAFLLNGCQSYEQGRRLVEQGAIGGIVTVSDVGNDAAIETGVLVARLLSGGFSLTDSLDIARRRTVVGGQYLAVGDNNVTIAVAPSAAPIVTHVESASESYQLWPEQFSTRDYGLGSHSMLRLPNTPVMLLGGESGPYDLTADEVLEYLHLQDTPVWFDGTFHWSSDMTRDDLE